MLLLPAVFDLGNYTYWRRRSIWLAIRAYLINAKDRKSTRLNSSHGYISYAVFCLKKKKKQLLQRDGQELKYRITSHTSSSQVPNYSHIRTPPSYHLNSVNRCTLIYLYQRHVYLY